MPTNLWKIDAQKGRIINGCDGETGTDFATVNQVGGNWIDWTPTYSANFTLGTKYYAKYRHTGNRVEFIIYVDGTTGAAPGASITFTLPITSANVHSIVFNGHCADGGAVISAYGYGSSTTVGNASKGDGTNWTAGAGRVFKMQGFYEA